jgi:cold shock CspA family protein/serine/threonine protein phosphatase PrpC
MNESLKRQFEQAAEADENVAKQRRTQREMGTVIVYDKTKGFGFILDVDDEKIFVHQSQLVSPGFRRLIEKQKVSFVRGENDGRPWAEDVRNPDGSPIVHKEDMEESSSAAKKRRQQLKEQWRNFFDIPQYALKSYAESLPPTVANQDAFGLGDAVPQLGKMFVVAHGCASTTGKGNECVSFVKDKMAKLVAKVYEETSDVAASLTTAFQMIEKEWIERAKNKSLTDGAEVMVGLFVHALNSSGQPCVQLWCAGTGTCVPLLCDASGTAVRLMEPHSTKKARAKLEEVGFDVNESGVAKVSFAEDAVNKPSTIFRLPAVRMIGGRPFKTTKAREKQAVHAVPDVKKVREWRCVAGEDLFLLICSAEVMSVLSDQDAINAAMDAWGGASAVDSWEAAAKAVVRTAQAQGPEFDTLACMAIQFWWQEKPLQRLLARRADKKRSGVVETKKAKDDFDMFG